MNECDLAPSYGRPGMMRESAVLSTFPLDNLLGEIQHLLGPVWALPPFNSFLPPYVNPPSARMQKEDLLLLAKKGALDVPDPTLIEEIVKAYIRHVHPHIPFLDLNSFTNAIFGNHRYRGCELQRPRVSLLLFQAVMFAGTMFVDLKHLYAAGFLSRKNAKEAFFQRARALYDLDAEDDQIAVIQSLLLMTYWFENPEKHKDGRHWTSVCISLACKSGLFSEEMEGSLISDSFRNRLRWSIFTRDRLIAVGLEQPPLVKDQFYSTIPTLAIDDFEMLHPQPGIEDAVSDYNTHAESLALIFIEKTKLCRCIRDCVFSWESREPTPQRLVIKARRAGLGLVRKELDDWLNEAPESVTFRPNLFQPTNNADLILYSHCAWLKIAYLDIYRTVHGQLYLLSDHYSPHKPLSPTFADSPVFSSTAELTGVLQDLYQKNLIYSLPTTCVAIILRSSIVHMQEMQLGNADMQLASLRGFEQCIRALLQLGRIYGSALLLRCLLRVPNVGSTPTCSPEEALAYVDVESLNQLALLSFETPSSTVLRIRDPYYANIVSRLKS